MSTNPEWNEELEIEVAELEEKIEKDFQRGLLKWTIRQIGSIILYVLLWNYWEPIRYVLILHIPLALFALYMLFRLRGMKERAREIHDNITTDQE